jgi:hypothetical protein
MLGTPPIYHALAEYRLIRFVSDNTPTTVPFHSNPNATEEAIILAAQELMAAKLLAFENTFDEPAAGKPWQNIGIGGLL